MLKFQSSSQKAIERRAKKSDIRREDIAADFVRQLEAKLGKAEKCQVISYFDNNSKKMRSKK